MPFNFVVIALIGASAATYAAIHGLSGTHFHPPCYVSSFMDSQTPGHEHKISQHTNLNCCGHYQNVSRFNDLNFCSEPDLNFYN